MNYDGLVYRTLRRLTDFVISIHWMKFRSLFNDAKAFDVTYDEKKDIEAFLRTNNYFILTIHKSYLSTFMIRLMTLIKTGVWPDYCHILMNLEVGNKHDREGFSLMEALHDGVQYSGYSEVFDCDNVCILKPKNITEDEWSVIMVGLNKQLGKAYDDAFNIKDNSRVSCVEMCLDALKELPNFEENFPHLSEMIKTVGNLTPQMYRDCRDFDVVYETKH